MESVTKAEFEAYLQQTRSTGASAPSYQTNRPFTPHHILEEYWTNKRVREALSSVARRYQFSQEDVTTIQERYLAGFSTLVITQNIAAIYYFIQHAHLEDHHLPFPSKDQPPHKWPSGQEIYELFYKEQWQFCPQHFRRDLLRDPELEEDRILPIIESKILISGSGDLASVYKIKLHSGYNFLCDQPCLNPKTDFVLKTFNTNDARQCYYNEKAAFQRLTKDNKFVNNLIGFYGCWRQGGTYNILLEWADGGTLLDYFHQIKPPTSEKDITDFWKGLLRIIEPLQRIHELRSSEGGDGLLQGIHQDVKPANILWLRSSSNSDYDVEFKLADLGLSHFERILRPDDEPLGCNDTHGTQAYSAPECCRTKFLQQSDLKVTSVVDIWSLGCVFSESLAWVVLGEAGRNVYAILRREYIASEHPKFAVAGYNDCFHNGRDVLPVVDRMHARLRRERRVSDLFAEHIIRLIREMLQPRWRSRCDAAEVVRIRDRIFEDIEDNPYPGPFKTLNGPVVPVRNLIPANMNIKENGQHKNCYSGTCQTPSIPEVTTANLRQTPPQTPFPPERSMESHAPQESRNSQRHGQLQGLKIYSSPIITGSHMDQVERSPDAGGHQSLVRRPSAHQSSQADIRQPSCPSPFGGHRRTSTIDSLLYDTTSGTRQSRFSIQGFASMASPSLSPVAAPAFTLTTNLSQTPSLSIQEVLNMESNRNPPYQEYLGRLKGRDHVFLVDDSFSMSSNWQSVIRTFRALASIVKRADPDGMDLYWASNATYTNCKHRKSLVAELTRKKPLGRCNMKYALSAILDRFGKELRASGDETKPKSRMRAALSTQKKKTGLSVYVLTDGVWQEGPDPVCGVEEPIRNIISMLDENRQLDLKVGIQFIRFGNDPIGEHRLDLLDNLKDLLPDIHMDIVDTTKYDGNVLKMLLGAFDRFWDGDDPAHSSSRSTHVSDYQNGYHNGVQGN